MRHQVLPYRFTATSAFASCTDGKGSKMLTVETEVHPSKPPASEFVVRRNSRKVLRTCDYSEACKKYNSLEP